MLSLMTVTCDKCMGSGVFPPPLSVERFLEWVNERMATGRSLADVGVELGVTRQAVQYWLSGVNRPSRGTLLLAERLIEEEQRRIPLNLVAGRLP